MTTIPAPVINEQKPALNRPKPRTRGSINRKTAQAAELAINHDIPTDLAYQLIHQKVPHRTTLERFSKTVEKWSITQPKAQKIAHTTLRKFAAGKDVNGIVPNSGTVIQAATRIIDQVTPVVKQAVTVSVNLDIDPVTVSQYMVPGEQTDTIDVTGY